MAEKAKKVNPFLQAKLAEFGKTEVDVITEQVTAFLEQGEIDINSQITHRTVSVIPTLNLDLTNAKKALAKAQKALAKAETEVPSNYRLETYLETLYSAETAVDVPGLHGAGHGGEWRLCIAAHNGICSRYRPYGHPH